MGEEKLQKKEEVEEKDLGKEKLQKKPIFESNAEPPDDENNIQLRFDICKVLLEMGGAGHGLIWKRIYETRKYEERIMKKWFVKNEKNEEEQVQMRFQPETKFMTPAYWRISRTSTQSLNLEQAERKSEEWRVKS